MAQATREDRAPVMEQILAKALEQDAAHLAAEEKQSLLARLLARLAHDEPGVAGCVLPAGPRWGGVSA